MARRLLPALALVLIGQAGPSPTAILTAEYRGAPTARDLSVLRAGVRNGEVEIQRLAVRAIGRLERPTLIPDLLPPLRSQLPEIRVQAADAIGQAALGWKSLGPTGRAAGIDSLLQTLVGRLKIERDPAVRRAIDDTLGRLPYSSPGQIAVAETALTDVAPSETVTDRLGVATAAASLVREHYPTWSPTDKLVAELRGFVASDPSRDARVRRLALEALATADLVDDGDITRAARDPDVQVRRLAMDASARRRSSQAARLKKSHQTATANPPASPPRTP